MQFREKYQKEHSTEKGMFLETAHPVKFYDVVEPILERPVEIPPAIKQLLTKEKKSIKMLGKYELLKEFLLGMK